MIKKLLLRGGLGLLLAAALVAGLLVYRAQSSHTRAAEMARYELWPQARQQLRQYLWLHPRDGDANMLMAELFVNDNELLSEDAARRAIAHLARIADSDPQGADARRQQAKLTFLVLQQPAQAEPLCRRALELAPQDIPALRLLWTLLDFTGRHEYAEDVFWRLYDVSPQQERPLLLRQWYMSQFFPTSSGESLDRVLGILAPNELPSPTALSRRFLRIREREPEPGLGNAALANWSRQERDLSFALALLQEIQAPLATDSQQAFHLATLTAVLFDLGRFKQASAALEIWPHGERGHHYWKWRAVIMDEVAAENDQAIDAYERALSIWPGSIDWRLRNRLANCISRTGDQQRAATARARAKEVEELMSVETHERVRTALGSLDDPKQVQVVIDFYQRLDRPREVDGWRQFAAGLSEAGASASQ